MFLIFTEMKWSNMRWKLPAIAILQIFKKLKKKLPKIANMILENEIEFKKVMVMEI